MQKNTRSFYYFVIILQFATKRRLWPGPSEKWLVETMSIRRQNYVDTMSKRCRNDYEMMTNDDDSMSKLFRFDVETSLVRFDVDTNLIRFDDEIILIRCPLMSKRFRFDIVSIMIKAIRSAFDIV